VSQDDGGAFSRGLASSAPTPGRERRRSLSAPSIGIDSLFA
jgi:hypothetical protein